MSHQWKIAERFKINYYPDIGLNPPHAKYVDSFGVKTFRVVGFYRVYQPPPRKVPKTPREKFAQQILDEIRQERRESMSDREALLEKFEVRLERVRFEDAEFIYGQSVGYPMVPIEWCEFLGDVDWSQEALTRARREYEKRLKVPADEFDLIDKHTHPRFGDAVIQLGRAGLEGGDRFGCREYAYQDQWCRFYTGKGLHVF